MTSWSLVLVQLAALRRHGWSTADALDACAAPLEAGPKSKVNAIARALAEGRGPPVDDKDPAIAALARADDLPPEQLVEVARALETRAHLGNRSRAALRRVAMVSGLALVLLIFGGELAGQFARLYADAGGVMLPVPTALSIDLLLLAKAWYLGPIGLLAIGLMTTFNKWEGIAPGQRSIRCVDRLRWLSARASAGSEVGDLQDDAELPLDKLERLHLQRLMARHPPRSASMMLADAMERSEVRQTLSARHGIALGIGFGAVALAVATLLSLYLPLFTIAGSIQ